MVTNKSRGEIEEQIFRAKQHNRNIINVPFKHDLYGEGVIDTLQWILDDNNKFPEPFDENYETNS